jgi:hypothetical protein
VSSAEANIEGDLLTYMKWLQLLRHKRDQCHKRNRTQHNRHLPNPLHLDRQSWSRLGDLQMATSTWLRPPRLRNSSIQRSRLSTNNQLPAKTKTRRSTRDGFELTNRSSIFLAFTYVQHTQPHHLQSMSFTILPMHQIRQRTAHNNIHRRPVSPSKIENVHA